jgi:Asp-tRNA(Asn)/Glu-tRNA(Gln) amidotransferase A subunit family amidase
VTDAARAIAEGRLSPVALVEACLARIEAAEGELRAWVHVDGASALAVAREREAEARAGRFRGPLHGIPAGIKDIIHVAGLPTTAGAAAFAHEKPDRDATAVARLRAAGAVIIGKTATTEFAYMDPAETRNPWNRDHTPGGSSSGSAAAVASRMIPLALGSQTVGSVLRPAAYCGVVGLKATHGLVPADGVIPLAWSLDHVGCFTRSVADAALVLAVLAGRGATMPIGALPTAATSPAAATPPTAAAPLLAAATSPPSSAAVSPAAITPPTATAPPPSSAAVLSAAAPPALPAARTVGVPRAWIERASPEVAAHVLSVAERLATAGASVEAVTLPASIVEIDAVGRIVLKVEAAAYHSQRFGTALAGHRPGIRDLVRSGLALSGVEYVRANRARAAFREEMAPLFDRYEVLLTPVALVPAPKGLASTGDPSFCAPWSFIGAPSIALPSGLAVNGLPLAVQLTAGAGSEDRLLSAAAWCESVLDFREAPPD